MSVKARVLRAIEAELASQEAVLELLKAGGTLGLVVKLDAAGNPRRIAVRAEAEHDVERTRPCRVPG